MIDLAKIVEKIEARLAEIGMTAAEISAKATGSKDTIRNWKRALEADHATGASEASATTIKLNQVESIIGIELARNADETSLKAKTDAEIARVVKQIDGVGDYEADLIISFIRGPLAAVAAGSKRSDDRDQRMEANHRRESAPSR